MGRFGFGQALRRVEDDRFLTGQGLYTDDVTLPGQAVGYVVRSPYAHGDITALDVSAARQMPGVLAVLTDADLKAAGIGDLPCVVRPTGTNGQKMPVPDRPVLARGRVRYVGEPVAFVVAETLEQARDAAEQIVLDVDILPAVADLAAAVAPDAVPLWPDHAPGNVLTDFALGDAAAVEAAFAAATHRVSLDLVNNRLAPTPLEPRGAVASFDPADGSYTLYTGSQGSHTLRDWLCRLVLNLPPEKLRVVAGDVGGGFGMRLFLYNEQVLVLAAARLTGRPVRWIADRGEGFQSDTHGRDQRNHAELALDAGGRILALRVRSLGNVGAYLSQMGAFVPTMAGTSMLTGVYHVPVAYAHVQVVVTNTAPVDAYRGAGRPEAAYVIERLMDAAARQLGLPRDEIRRRNFPVALPYKTAFGHVYDSGDFPRLLETAQARADWAGFEARRADARQRGRLRGLGISYYVEVCGGGGDETAQVELHADGTATVLIGTQSTGQGHETAYAQMVAAEFGISPQAVRVKQGDTAVVPTGKGTGGSRSLPVGGASLSQAVDGVIALARPLAAARLGAAEDTVRFEDGVFLAPASNEGVRLTDLAASAPAGTLTATAAWKPPAGTYPNGCHLVEVEIDPDTGATEVLRYTIVDDVGVVINPLLLKGQVVGGVAQGLGQALCEAVVYEADSGQLLTGSLMDYALPRADSLPDIDFSTVEIPCTTNLLGVKGAGEAGTIGSTPAVMSAVLDALAPCGITHLDMPATPLAVWTALQSAGTRP